MMRTLPAFIPAVAVATFGCLLTAPVVAFAADGENTPLNLPSDSPEKAVHSAAGGGLVRTIFGLAVVIAVIYGLTWVLKKIKASKEAGASGAGLENIATLPLGTNRALHLVRAGGEVVLIGVAEHSITPIRRFSEDEARALGLIDVPAPPNATLEALGGTVSTARPTTVGGLMRTLRARTVVK
jgi:flagellar protein FliO/FliZ